MSAEKETVTIPLETALHIYRAFLPLNPNKLRNASPAVKQAAHDFKRIVAEAARKGGAL